MVVLKKIGSNPVIASQPNGYIKYRMLVKVFELGTSIAVSNLCCRM